MTMPRFVNPAGVAPPIGAYSHLAIVPTGSETLYIAGQIGNFPDGRMAPDITGQYRQTLANIVALLEAEGLTPAHLVKLNTWLVTPMEIEAVRAIRKEILGDVRPAAMIARVMALATPEIQVEIEGIAVRPP